MGGGMGCLPGSRHVYLSRAVYMERILPGHFSFRPGKAGYRDPS